MARSRSWALGYRADALSAILDALPPYLTDALLRAFAALRAVGGRRRRAALAARQADPAAAGRGTGEPGPCGSPLRAEDFLPSFGGGGLLGGPADAGLWEGLPMGHLCVAYDGATQQRRAVAMNGRHADLLGVHREALARFAARDLPLALSGADFLAVVAHGLGVATRTHAERYMRLTLGFGAGRRGMLVHNYNVKTFNV
jgi:hypothetical protein